MYLKHKLNKIRTPANPTIKQSIYSIAFAIVMGLALGFLSKLFDSPYIPSILGIIGSRLGIWIFISTILASFSYAPRIASFRVFAFFVSMLIVYYLYTVFFLHFVPEKYMMFWSKLALLSPIFAYVIWYSHGESWLSNILVALPISIILQEGYEVYLSTKRYYQQFEGKGYFISDRDYYNMLQLEIVYFCFIFLILFLLPQNKKQSLIIIPLSIIIFLFLAKTNLLTFLFNAINGYL